MKGASEVMELFSQFPKTEFDAEGVIANSYVSGASTRRVLKQLYESGFLTYRYVETLKSAKRLYKLNTVITEPQSV